MSGEDFFVNFGSNADTFARETRRELETIQSMVNGLNESFASMKGINLDELIKGDPNQIKKIRASLLKDLETRGGGAGGGVAAGSGHIYTESLNSAIESMAGELKGLIDMVNRATQSNLALLGSTQNLVRRIAGAGGALPREDAGAPAATPYRAATGKGNSGSFAKATTPGAIADDSPEGRARKKGASAGAIQTITKAQLDTAEFDRMISAIHRVEEAVRETGRPTQDLGALLSGFQQVLSQSASATAEIAKASKGPKISNKELDRRARVQNSLDFSVQDEDTIRQSVGRSKNKLGRPELIQIAQDLTSQGFSTGAINKRTTNEDLIRSIIGAGEQYKRSGFATKEDLTLTKSRVVQSAQISSDVREMMGSLFNSVNLEALSAAREIVGTDRKAGGTGPLRAVAGTSAPQGSYSADRLIAQRDELSVQQRELQNQLGGAKTGAKKKSIQARIDAVAAELDDLEVKIQAASGEIQAGGSVQNLRQGVKGRQSFGIAPIADELASKGGGEALVRGAYETLDDFEHKVKAHVLQLAQSRGFQPFGPEVSKQIQGDDENAIRARSVLSMIRKGIIELDDEARDFYKMTDRQQNASQRPNADLFRSESFYGGYLARQVPEASYTESRLQSRRRYEHAKELYEGVNETIAGASTMPGSRFERTRRVSGTILTKLGIGLEDETIDPKVAKQIRNAAKRYSTALLLAARMYEDEADSAKALDRQVKAADKLLERLFKATGNAPSIHQFLESQPGWLSAHKIPQEMLDRDTDRQLAIERLKTPSLGSKDGVLSKRARAEKRALAGNSDDVVLAKAGEQLAALQKKAVAAEQKLAQSRTSIATAQEKLRKKEESLVAALSEEEKGALAAAEAKMAAAAAERDILLGQAYKLEGQAGRRFQKNREPAPPLQTEALGEGQLGPAKPSPEYLAHNAQMAKYDQQLIQTRAQIQETYDRERDLREARAAIIGGDTSRERKAVTAARTRETKAAEVESKAAEQLQRRYATLVGAVEGRVKSAQDNLHQVRIKNSPDAERFFAGGAAGVEEKHKGAAPVPGSVGAEAIPKAEERLREAQAELVRVTGLSMEQFAKELQAKGEKAAKEIDQATETVAQAGGTVEEVKANTAERDALVAERRALAAQRTKVSNEKKTLVAQDEATLTRGQKGARTRKINALAQEYKDITGQINTLDAQIRGAGGAGGGGGKRTGGGGAGSAGGSGGSGQYNRILQQILEAINRVNTTLKAGVPTKGTTTARGSTVVGTGGGASTPSVPGGGARLTAEQKRAAEERRAAARDLAANRGDLKIQEETLRLAADKERIEKLAAAATNQAAEADIAAATAATALAVARGRVSQSTQAELDKLKQLTSTGASAEEIARQRLRTNLAIRGDLDHAAQGAGLDRASEVDKAQTSRSLIEGAQGASLATGAFKQLNDSTKAVEQAVATTGQKSFGDQSPLRQAISAALGPSGFWARIVHTTGTFIVRNFAAGFVFGITNALQQVIKQAILTEQTFVRVSNALEATGKSVGGLRADLQSVSTDYGTSLNDVYDVAAGLVGLFKTPTEIASATRIVAQLETISDGALNAHEAMGALASITSSYSDDLNGSVDGFSHVADVLTTVQNVIGTNVEVTAEGVASLSGLARQLHLSYEQVSVIVGQVAKQTNQTGAAAGEQIGRILGALQTGRGQRPILNAFSQGGKNNKIDKDQASALKAAFSSGDYGSAITLLMQNWDNLSKSQQRNIAITVAGQRQMRSFAALMNNTKASLDAIDKATNEQGSAQERMSKIMNTLNGQVRKLHANFQNLANNLVRSGVLDAALIALKAMNAVLSTINNVLTRINDFTDSSGLTKFLKQATFGALGLVAAFNLLKAAKSGIGAAITAKTVAGRAALAETAAGGAGGTAAITDPGVLALLLGSRRNRAIEDGVEKIPLGRRLSQRGEELGRRADIYRLRRSPLNAEGDFPRSNAVTGIGRAADRGLARAGAARLALTEAGALGASKAFGGLGTALTAVAEGGIAVQGPLVLAGAAALGFANEINRTRKITQENQKALEEFNNRIGRKTTKKDEDALLSGTTRFIKKAHSNVKTGFSGFFSVASEAVRDATHGNLKDIANGKYVMSGLTRHYGTDESGRQTYGLSAASGRLQQGLKTLSPLKTVGEVQKAQADFNEQAGKELDKILASDASAAQKKSALKNYNTIVKDYQKQAELVILKINGLSAVDQMTADETDAVLAAMQSIQQLGGKASAGGISLRTTYQAILAQSGVDPKSQIGQSLTGLTSGIHDDVATAANTRKVLQVALKQTQASIETTSFDNPDYARLVTLATTLGAQLLNNTDDLIKTQQSEAETAAGLYSKLGQYGKAAAAYKPAIQTAKDKLTIDSGHAPASLAPLGGLANPVDQQQVLVDRAKVNELTRAGADALLAKKLANLRRQLADADPEMAKTINREIDRVIADFQGKHAGLYSPDEVNQSKTTAKADDLAKSQDDLAKRQAAIGTRTAAAGPSNALAIARGQLQQAQLAQAEAGKISTTSVDYQNATQQVIAAQFAIQSAEGDITQANANLRAAYANARGDTVGAARAGLAAANAALGLARRLSGGARSAEVINAQAQVVQARAAVQDARLQDQQDTIDFNLQMGKITSAAAIQALQHILAVEKLNKQQRRALLLKIKGMKDELSSDGQWNFGSINLPTPYSVRRYLAQQKLNQQQSLASAAGFDNRYDVGAFGRGGGSRVSSTTDARTTTILVNGADTAKVLSLIRQVVGSGVRIRTTQARRR